MHVAKTLATGARFVAEGLGGVLFPADCLRCEQLLCAPLRGPLCTDCVSALPWIEAPHCPRCGLPYFTGVAHGKCGPCRTNTRWYRRARAGLVYDADVRRLLHRLKFGKCERIASILGGESARRWVEVGALGAYHAIVPVPLSRKRRLARGFNQAERVAESVGCVLGAPVRSRLLRKIEDRPPQAGLSARARRDNAHRAYRSKIPSRLIGADVLLVDDVLTTGATVESAARALLENGIGTVDVLTVSRVL